MWFHNARIDELRAEVIDELRAEVMKRDGIAPPVKDSALHASYLMAAAVVEVAAELQRVARALAENRSWSDHPLMGETFEGVAEALTAIASAIEDRKE